MVDEFLREDLPCSGDGGSRKLDVGYLGFFGWLVDKLRPLELCGRSALLPEDRAAPATESVTCGIRINKMM